MKPRFEHFLFTRINLGYIERISGKNLNESDWLNYRFDVFYKTCLPSVINQNCQNFTWLIYLDCRTPDSIVNRLKEKISGYPNFMILLREGGFESLTVHAPNDIKALLEPDLTYIITSRIDSDDLIHCDFIQEVQSKFDFQEYLSINFTYGWVHDLNSGILGKFKGRSNSFISLVEKLNYAGILKTVCHQSHTQFLFEKERLEITTGKRLWCVTIHDTNDSTKFKGLPVLIKPNQIEKDFNFSFKSNFNFLQNLSFLFSYYKRQFKKVPKYLTSRI